MKFPKIVLFSYELPPKIGGVADYTVMLKENLEKLGLRVSLSGNLSKIKVAPEIFHLQYQGYLYPWFFGLKFFPLWLKIKLKGGKFLVTFHDFSTPNFLFYGNISSLLLFSNKVIVTDKTPKVQKLRRFPFFKKKIKFVPLGSNIKKTKIKEAEKKKLRKKYNLEDNFVFSYFGLIRSDKGLETLFKALNKLKGKFKLLMIGEKPPEKWLRSGKVVATGFLESPEVSKLLSVSDVAVFPFTDGVSLRRESLLAALVHNLPTISTRGSYVPRILKEGENIFLVPPGNVDLLANAMHKLMRDEILREKLAVGVRKLSSYFSWEKVAKEHLKLYYDRGYPCQGVTPNEE